MPCADHCIAVNTLASSVTLTTGNTRGPQTVATVTKHTLGKMRSYLPGQNTFPFVAATTKTKCRMKEMLNFGLRVRLASWRANMSKLRHVDLHWKYH